MRCVMFPRPWYAPSILALVVVAGCAGGSEPTGPGLSIAVAPLRLDAIDFACFDILVSNAPAGAGCGGRMGVIAAIHDPDAITAILPAAHSDKWSVQTTGPPARDPQLASDAA